jgi:hypothetical protein
MRRNEGRPLVARRPAQPPHVLVQTGNGQRWALPAWLCAPHFLERDCPLAYARPLMCVWYGALRGGALVQGGDVLSPAHGGAAAGAMDAADGGGGHGAARPVRRGGCPAGPRLRGCSERILQGDTGVSCVPVPGPGGAGRCCRARAVGAPPVHSPCTPPPAMRCGAGQMRDAVHATCAEHNNTFAAGSQCACCPGSLSRPPATRWAS